jgi:hypothetical protein
MAESISVSDTMDDALRAVVNETQARFEQDSTPEHRAALLRAIRVFTYRVLYTSVPSIPDSPGLPQDAL